MFALKGRTLPSNAVRLLNLIPPAAFAALVANDLIVLDSWATGPWPAMIPWISAALVFVVGYKTKSLVWCIVAASPPTRCSCSSNRRFLDSAHFARFARNDQSRQLVSSP